jgi:probable F420-dependent oxidoreductase
VEELGFGTLWVPETVGRHPFTLLGLLAAETTTMNLGTSIVGIYGHDAQATRMAALTLAEATGGRFVLGLGVSHPHLVTKLRGHEFGRPVSAMRDFLAAYHAAPWRGPAVRDEPPILVAALRDRMLGLAATDADGAFPYLVTPERVAAMRATLDAARGDGSRPVVAVTCPAVLETDPDAARAAARAYLAPYLRTPTYHASWELQGFDATDWEKPGSDALVDAMVAWGNADAIRVRIAAFVEAGADHVALIPLAADGLTEHLPVLEALAR